jgi:hypothetical protein
MTKKLTEQWRNRTLPNGKTFWCQDDEGNVAKLIHIRRKFFEWTISEQDDTEQVKEVLALVPTYEEWKAAYECQLMESEEVLTLKHQLKEAKKILYDVWDCRGSREFYAEKAKEYFEKWGVE